MTASTDETVLDLGLDPELEEQYGFYYKSPKEAPSGLPFVSFAGLHYYLITGRCHRELLKGERLEELKNTPWTFVPDLDEILYTSLVIHLAKYPLVEIKLQGKRRFEWTMDRELNGAEKRWLDTLNHYLSRLA